MKKRGLKIISRIAVITAVLTSVLLHTTAQAAGVLYDLPSNMKISAKSAILVSLGATPEEDTVLYEKQPDSKRSPAALVRMMVGVTAIEIIRDKGIDIDKVTGKYSSEAFNIIAGTGLTTVQMQFGEEWTIRDLLSISMIQTAADACVTLAITLSGSHSQFVAEMNKLAKKIGCENTSFANVTGIDSLNQYTTVRDLYKIMRYAMD
jgi:D-alanyl-D-alanine carboxypeptidase (penicillin-binding protein 5/6)